MTPALEDLARQAQSLSDSDKLRLVDALLVQVHKPDPAIESAWLAEVENRRAAYLGGTLNASPAEDVLRKLRQR